MADTDAVNTARYMLHQSFADGLEALNEVDKVLPLAALPGSPKLRDEIQRARTALAKAWRIVEALEKTDG